MLQQTQVATVLRYYEPFLQRFPNFSALAQASQEEVLSAWQGMGYYQRALSLQRTARIVVQGYGGRLPRDYRKLRALPGIGDYTAKALLAFCYEEPCLAFDSNIRRVLCRLFHVRDFARGKQRLGTIGAELVLLNRPSRLNQALMDLGAQVCLPHAPQCHRCPLTRWCQAYQSGNPAAVPDRDGTRATERQEELVIVIRKSGPRFLVLHRRVDQRWGGLWEFPRLGPWPVSDSIEAERWPEIFQKQFGVQIVPGVLLASFTYSVLQVRVRVRVWTGRHAAGAIHCRPEHDGFRWLPKERLCNLPMSSPQDRIRRMLLTMSSSTSPRFDLLHRSSPRRTGRTKTHV
jgi:A/G-specific adenine glycosylase